VKTKLFSAFLAVLLLSNKANAQSNQDRLYSGLSAKQLISNKGNPQSNKLHLYASLGFKQLQDQQLYFNKEITPTTASARGAGGIYQKERWLLGSEFYYLSGHKEVGALEAEYSGLRSSALIGYQVKKNKSLKINLLTGFGYSLNHLYVTDFSKLNAGHYNSAMFHNNGYYVPAAIFVQKVKPNGTFLGVKAGYNFTVSKNSNWELRQKEHNSYYNAKTGGFYIQLLLGGMLSL
jgi:hypothetical protein